MDGIAMRLVAFSDFLQLNLQFGEDGSYLMAIACIGGLETHIIRIRNNIKFLFGWEYGTDYLG